MKANVKSVKKPSVILSVGMIVKNEERHLENCLKALKPFLDSIQSELIIVDTGSEDATKEIAQRYTDKVYDFEWCNDFSAARNAGLQKARGEWFMFVDADEYLDDDFSEMTKFFRFPEVNKKYNSASVIIRSYTNSENKVYVDFLGSRIVRLLPETRFDGVIHECLPMPQPHGCFSTVFHHYGYKYKTKAERNVKFKRNLELLRGEYEKNPDDLRILSHIYDCALDPDEKREFLLRAYDISREKPLSMYSCCAYLNMVAYYAVSDKRRAVELAEEFLSREGALDRVSAVQICSSAANLLCELQEYEKASDCFAKYFELYDGYHAGKLNNSDMRARGIRGITPFDRDAFSTSAALCEFRLGRKERALEILSECHITEMPTSLLRDTLPLLRDICINTGCFTLLGKIYADMVSKKEEYPTALEIFTAMLSDIYYTLSEKQRTDFARAIGECGCETPLCVLMRIISLEDITGFSVVLGDFCAVCTDWNGCIAEAVWLCMKHGVSLNKAAANMDYKALRGMFPLLCRKHDDFPEVALAYAEIFIVENLTDLLLLTSMLETASLAATEMRDELRLELYNLFTSALGDYVLNVYNSELFNDEDIRVLPPLHRFGYYMAQAHLNLANATEYMKNLRNALKCAPETKDIVAFLMDDYTRKYITE